MSYLKYRPLAAGIRLSSLSRDFLNARAVVMGYFFVLDLFYIHNKPPRAISFRARFAVPCAVYAWPSAMLRSRSQRT